MTLRFKFALWALISLVVLGGCQNEATERTREPLDEQYKLIDREDYSQAILNLQDLLRKDPRPEVKVALASAYAGRAGIRTEKYWGFLVGFEAPLAPLGTIPENATMVSLQKIIKHSKGELHPKDLQALEGISKALDLWERYKGRVDSIPTVKGPALKDLKVAVEILTPVQTPGGRLYRGVLNLILFKSYLVASEGFLLDFNKIIKELLAGNIEVFCQFNFDQFLEWLNPLSYHLLETLNDLMVAFPEDRKDLEEARNLIQGIYELTQDALQELRKKRTCS